MLDDSRSYYVLGYRPSNAALDGSFRSITVKVKRPNVDVRARKGFAPHSALSARSGSTRSAARAGR